MHTIPLSNPTFAKLAVSEGTLGGHSSQDFPGTLPLQTPTPVDNIYGYIEVVSYSEQKVREFTKEVSSVSV